jgi:NADPH:quinone reductase-like Zn-dependent oxidoreductase
LPGTDYRLSQSISSQNIIVMAPIALNIPSRQKAIIVDPAGEFVVSENVPVTELEPDALIIKTMAVALNPADTKMLGDFVVPGTIFGFDCSGIVIAVGPAVNKVFAPGDRVCGSADDMNRQRPRGGAFAEYVSLPGDMALKIPDSVSFEAAAALGTALVSAGLALFYSLKIPASLLQEPTQDHFPVLVYGGSTSTETMAIQLLKWYETHYSRSLHSQNTLAGSLSNCDTGVTSDRP